MESILNFVRYSVRLMFFIVSNLYALPCYLVWMTLLCPLRYIASDLYWKLESRMFRILECMVVTWLSSGGYKVLECGDDIDILHDKEAIFLCNHQSTADTPLIMLAHYLKGLASGTAMWIMLKVFRYTNFGLVSMHRGDFFIDQGKDVRLLQLERLKQHLTDSYLPHNRKWIYVFPEGGFLYKRLESSQQYAQKNGYPLLEHTSLPRIGAIKTILDVVGEPYEENSNANPPLHSVSDDVIAGHDHQMKEMEKPLKWVVDMTLAYTDGKPLDMLGMCIGYCPQKTIVLHYRAYRAKDVPRDETALTTWLYQRYAEKDKILDYFYKNGEISQEVLLEKRDSPAKKVSYLKFDLIDQILVHSFFIISCYIHYIYLYKPFWALLCYSFSLVF